jgi:hypothetical protein
MDWLERTGSHLRTPEFIFELQGTHGTTNLPHGSENSLLETEKNMAPQPNPRGESTLIAVIELLQDQLAGQPRKNMWIFLAPKLAQVVELLRSPM